MYRAKKLDRVRSPDGSADKGETRLVAQPRRIEKATILKFRCTGRTDWAAVDARRENGYKNPAVEARVARQQGTIKSLVIEQHHGSIVAQDSGARWRFSDALD